MRVVIAPDSLKGSCRAKDAAAAIAKGWLSSRPHDEVLLRPMADGGEGTLDAFQAAVAGSERRPVTVVGPDNADVESSWLLLPPTPDAPRGTGVVELASTSGIELLGERRLPWDAHTTGFGEAIAAALDAGVSRLVLGIGSSASTDAGVGMLTALGARFVTASGEPVPPGARGLVDLAACDLSGLRRMPDGGVAVFSDVTNPLLGRDGATTVFGPQKGLAPWDMGLVEEGLERVVAVTGGDPQFPGAGAAGGTGFALHLWGATFESGAAGLADVVGLPAAIAGADLVITAEGRFDATSSHGKAPAAIASAAKEARVPTLLIAGSIDPDADVSQFAVALSLTELANSAELAQTQPERWLRVAAKQAAASASP